MFNDVSSRCPGRLDIRHGTDEQVFTDLAYTADWFPVVKEVLGNDMILNYCGQHHRQQSLAPTRTLLEAHFSYPSVVL